MSDAGLANCVERLLGSDAGAAPPDRADLGEWLAARGLALAFVAEPESFSMAGSFLARRGEGWTVAFGAPPGTLFDPESGADGGAIVEAAVLAPLELGSRAVLERANGPLRGRVVTIAVAAEAEAGMTEVQRASAIAGAGLEGDRYSRGEGTFSRRGGSGRDLTLIEADAIDELARAGVELPALEARRNVVVEGVSLDALIGRRFRVGEVECLGARRCEPCAHLERLTAPGVLRGLVHRGGLRADVTAGGEIAVGDELVSLD